MGWFGSTRQGLFTMADDLEQQPQGWLSSWLPTWRPTSMSQLKNVEARILQCLQNKFLARYVSLPNQNKIWTVTVSPELRDRTPLVMVHGFGGGVGLWILNMDSLSARRTLHTFDLLGFGRSSRPTFPRDPEGAEDEFVTSIETWRETMGIPSMILLGHSLGGFLATSYSIKYPDRVKHLILVDPWGFPLRPTDPSEIRAPPTWVKAVASVLGRSNPLAVLRVAGPWGEYPADGETVAGRRDPLPGLENGLFSNTWKGIVQGDTRADKARDFIGKGHLGREQQGKGTQENGSSVWLTVSGFMGMGSVSWLSPANRLAQPVLGLAQGPSWWHLHLSAKMESNAKDAGRLAVSSLLSAPPKFSPLVIRAAPCSLSGPRAVKQLLQVAIALGQGGAVWVNGPLTKLSPLNCPVLEAPLIWTLTIPTYSCKMGIGLALLLKTVTLDQMSLQFQKVHFFSFICMEKAFLCKG
uniref:Abhydrolase domain containing 4, N-acyl phospholipase B n=2 Tax=Sus scrofa TaxID=9823 RepID=A0A8D0Y932_PIG